jgi:hypothetical protein
MIKRKHIIGTLIIIALSFFIIYRLNIKRSDQLNEQGVRPDVAQAIEDAFPNSKRTRLAALQLARAFQRAVDRPENAAEINKTYEKAISCIEAVSLAQNEPESDRISTQVESMVVNTWARSRSYVKYNARLSGGVFDMIQPDSKNCDFELR